MNAHKQGWFTEIGAPNGANVAQSVLVKEVLHEEKSQYQHITVFKRFVEYTIAPIYI